ncbi:thiamine phosphate synthase [Modestobacter lapidis]|nr:thiamine phosphate synthase [Modestobacter lapidis]
MRLPRLLVLTDRTQCAGPLVGTVAAAVDAGARAVVLREKDLPAGERAALAAQLRALLAPVGGLLVVAGPAPDGAEIAIMALRGAVHLAAADPFPAPRPALVGRSCHDAAEVARAREEGCNWVLVSPFDETASKPGYGPALGPGGLAALLAGGPPAYALGGVLPDDVPACLAAGAHGVAVMGPVMRDPTLAAAYLAALPDDPEEPAPCR